METGRGDRQIMFKDKEPDYQVDEAEVAFLTCATQRSCQQFSVDAAPPVAEKKDEKKN